MGRAATGPWRRKGRGWYYTVAGVDYRLDIAKDASKRAATEAWGQLRTPQHPTAGLTLREALGAFLAAREGSPSHSHYGLLVGDFVSFRGKDVAVADVIPNDVTQWWASHQKWGETMRGSALRHLKACLNWCVAEGLLEKNPVATKKAPRPATRDYLFSEAAFRAVLEHCSEPLAAFVRALWHTGARPSEIARATREHVAGDGSAIALPTGKQGARRITFPRDLWPWLKARREETKPHQPVFPDHHRGRAWNRTSWGHAFALARKAAGLPPQARCYQFRHSWITRNVVAGIPLGVIAAQVGTSIAMISARYSHLQPGDVELWRERMV